MGMFDDLRGTLENYEHPLMRQKRKDEEAGYANYTRPPNLEDLHGLGDDGVGWVMKNDWDTANSVEFDLDVIRGSGQGYDIAMFCVEREGGEREGGSIEQDQCEAAERLQKLKHLPPQRWREVYTQDEPKEQ
jgi:hypothetical protein